MTMEEFTATLQSLNYINCRDLVDAGLSEWRAGRFASDPVRSFLCMSASDKRLVWRFALKVRSSAPDDDALLLT